MSAPGVIKFKVDGVWKSVLMVEGPPGPPGIGLPGPSGADGLSAYQVAVVNGFSGSQSEWLESLNGDYSLDYIHFEKRKVGTITLSNKMYDIYQKAIHINPQQLNKVQGQTTDILIATGPLGRDILLDLQMLVVSSNGDFVQSKFSIDKFFIDSENNTILRLVCNETISSELTTSYIVIKFVENLMTYETLTLTIPNITTHVANPENLVVEFPVLKFNKDFAMVWSVDDGLTDAYNKLFKYALGQWVDYSKTYHEFNPHSGGQITTGEQPTRQLTYTDGLGNERIYSFDSAFFSYNTAGSDGIHNDEGTTVYQYISWRELVKFFDFNNSITNHGGGNETIGNEITSLTNNNNRINEKIGFQPFIVAPPGGAAEVSFEAATSQLDFVYYNRSKQSPVMASLQNISPVTFKTKSGIFGRIFSDNMSDKSFNGLKTFVDACAARTDFPLLYFASHGLVAPPNSDYNTGFKWEWVRDMLDYVKDEMGDRVLFVGPSELFEWLFTRVNSFITKQIVGNNLVITLKLAKLPSFYQKDLSLLIKSSTNFVSTPINFSVEGGTIVKSAIGTINPTTLMLNLNYNEHLLTLTEKYVNLYETSSTSVNFDNAMFFINRLNTNLAQPFIERLSSDVITLNSISCIEGATVPSRNITISINKTGTPTHYAISTSNPPTEWLEYTSNDVPFELPAVEGEYTIYVKLRRNLTETTVKSVVVNYSIPDLLI